MITDDIDRLLHDLGRKINAAVFALTLSPLPDAKDHAVDFLREADAMIDDFMDGGEHDDE